MSFPDDDPRIAGFLAKYTPAMEAQLAGARTGLRALFPRGFELVFDNYNALVFAIGPTERASDAFVSVAGYPKWVTLFFLHGTDLHDPEGLLQGEGKQVRGIRLKGPGDLDDPAVVALLRQAIAAQADALRVAPPLRTVVKMEAPKQRPRRPAKT